MMSCSDIPVLLSRREESSFLPTNAAAIATSVLVLAVLAFPVLAVEARLLVADLGGDGLLLTDRFFPVEIDLDGDLATETVSWTAQGHEDGFLWIDLNADGSVAGHELVGSEMRWDSTARTPFEILASFDGDARGGNEDGRLSPGDGGWDDLRIWIDSDHDGKSSPCEISRLRKWGIVEIEIEPRQMWRLDGGLNQHLAWSVMWTSPSEKRGGSNGGAKFLRLTEVAFVVLR